jgi:uncharacterized membrane protein
MALPVINLPQIDLPFAVPALIHPAVVHFAIAIPVIVLLLEFYNLFAKRKSIGGFSFLLLIVTVFVLIAAYFTGNVDGKEAYDLLSSDGQAELKAHKLLGVYMLFASIAVVIFKILAMTGKGFFRFLFFITLMGLIAITLIQGKEGGELVYEHGANVKIIKDMKFDLDDLKEELAELEEENAEEKKPLEAATVEAVTPTEPTQVETEVNATL